MCYDLLAMGIYNIMLQLSEYRDHASPARVLRFGSTVERLCSRIITTFPAVFNLHRDIVVTMLWRSLPFFTLSNESFVLDKGCVLTREDDNMPVGCLRLCLVCRLLRIENMSCNAYRGGGASLPNDTRYDFPILKKGSGGRNQFDRKETNYDGYSVTTRCKHSKVLKLRIF